MKLPHLKVLLTFYRVEPKKQAKNKSGLLEQYKRI